MSPLGLAQASIICGWLCTRDAGESPKSVAMTSGHEKCAEKNLGSGRNDAGQHCEPRS